MIISIIYFVIVGLGIGANGAVTAIIEQLNVPGSLHEVRNAPSYWYLGDTIKVSTYMIEDSTGVRYESDTLIITAKKK